MTTSDEHPELEELAQRYVLGELDEQSHTRFEDRLDADQTAREAVARAVSLIEALDGEAADEAPRERPTIAHANHSRWFVAAAAAGITLAAALGLVWASRDDATDERGPGAEALIASWIAFGDTLDATEDDEPWDDGDSDEDYEAPSWIYSALEDK